MHGYHPLRETGVVVVSGPLPQCEAVVPERPVEMPGQRTVLVPDIPLDEHPADIHYMP
ncbi:hypothetical protein [Bacteroides caecimuris]|uniref:hypothetical protein n=1 Tax=Bacteroides caecimuris TaxID=1796613 RepID=UPI003D9C2E96